MKDQKSDVDFEGLANALLARARELLPQWLPGGHVTGAEFICGNLRGDPGNSLRINVNTGKWADFATSDLKGGDLISLYAAIEGITQVESARILSELLAYQTPTKKPPAKRPEIQLAPPPPGFTGPSLHHKDHGEPSLVFEYRSIRGELLFYIVRYDPPSGKKQFIPYSFAPERNAWVKKAWTDSRPLYGLEHLTVNSDRPVLLVEGEKAADAARALCGKPYDVLSWSGGGSAWTKTDFAPIFGRKILLWPDADGPGRKVMNDLGMFLVEHTHEVKVIQVDDNAGWDAHDALTDGWNYKSFFAWAKDRLKNLQRAPPPVIVERAPPRAEIVVAGPDDIDIPISLQVMFDECGVVTTKNGQAVANVDNVLRVLEKWPSFKDLVWLDEFHQKFFTRWQSDTAREWSDTDTIRLMVTLQRSFGFTRVSETMIRQAVTDFGSRHPKNEPKDWLETLVWDQKPRVGSFFSQAFGTEDTDYSRAASMNWWISMVARVYSPGCKVDNMVILEGGQGKFKSTALGVIGGPWYTETNESVTSKDFFMVLQGKLLIEIGEWDSFSRAEVSTIKSAITRQTDRFRPPYGHAPKDFPRQCIFVGSTNETDYLRDSTGGRRFWPIEIGTIDVPYIRANRDQLFAEAASLYKIGAPWWIMPEGETLETQESRRQHDEWEDLVVSFLSMTSETTLMHIAVNCLKMEAARFDMPIQKRLGKIMRAIGWKKVVARRNGKLQKLWVRSDESIKAMGNTILPNEFLADDNGFQFQ